VYVKFHSSLQSSVHLGLGIAILGSRIPAHFSNPEIWDCHGLISGLKKSRVSVIIGHFHSPDCG